MQYVRRTEYAKIQDKIFKLEDFNDSYNREEYVKKKMPSLNGNISVQMEYIKKAKKDIIEIVINGKNKISYNGNRTAMYHYKIAINELIAEGRIKKKIKSLRQYIKEKIFPKEEQIYTAVFGEYIEAA